LLIVQRTTKLFEEEGKLLEDNKIRYGFKMPQKFSERIIKIIRSNKTILFNFYNSQTKIPYSASTNLIVVRSSKENSRKECPSMWTNQDFGQVNQTYMFVELNFQLIVFSVGPQLLFTQCKR
jgi:hypothetical protein